MKYQGLMIGLAIILLWLLSQLIVLSIFPLNSLSILLAVPVLTFLHTGLFITAHDAMHGTVCPSNRRVNEIIGRIAVFLYAVFSYKKLLAEHKLHHLHPGTEHDPDSHNSGSSSFLSWYLNFLWHYISWKQILAMALIFNFLQFVVGVSEFRLLIFWVLPSLLSTLQLFYFGTFLPHRRSDSGFADCHNSRSQRWSWFLSFISCYHFGYHLEHHRSPQTPWWRLPSC